jgi:hypothetical protein
MGFLNKYFIATSICIASFFFLSFCERSSDKSIEMSQNKDKLPIKEIEKYDDVVMEEIAKYDGIYYLAINNNSFVQKYDTTEKMEWSYLYNCAQIDSKSKRLIIQFTKNIDKFYFDIKKKNENHWILLSKQGNIDVDFEESYPGHIEIGLSFEDLKGRIRKTSITPISDKSLEACIERNNENYDNEIQFVKEQNNDGE